MRLSNERIKELQKILKDECGLELSDEEAQQAGLAIMRFVLVKETRKREIEKSGPKVQQQ
jgi:hypothetical protein